MGMTLKLILSCIGLFIGGITAYWQVHSGPGDVVVTAKFWIGFILAGLAPLGAYFVGLSQKAPWDGAASVNAGVAGTQATKLGLLLGLSVGLLLLPTAAAAFTCTPTDCTFIVKYTEPTTVVTGAPLNNLTSTTITYTITVDGLTPGPVKTVVVPASSPNGGGAITRNVPDTILVPGHNYVISATVLATNPSGNSPSSPAATLPIPRAGEVPPGGMPAPTLQ